MAFASTKRAKTGSMRKLAGSSSVSCEMRHRRGGGSAAGEVEWGLDQAMREGVEVAVRLAVEGTAGR